MPSTTPVDSLKGLAYWRASVEATAGSWRAMLDRRSLAGNVSAGFTVALVALPLNLALAIACGLPPSVGLVSGAVAGVVGALLGASRFQVTGPEVALAPITLAIVQKHGFEGLLVTTFLAGLLQIAFGVLRVGRLVGAIPVPVIGGFLAAVGLLVFDSQLPRLLGLPPEAIPLSEVRDVGLLLQADFSTLGLGLVVVAIVLLLPRLTKRVPPPLAALAVAVAAAAALGLRVPTIQPIEAAFPRPALPSFGGVDVVALLPDVLALALLASIDSLLCAVSVDARTGGERTRGDQELVAQGLANLACACFGAMPAAAAVVRSMAAVEAGASTRVAPLVQSVLLGLVLLVLAPFVTFVPIVALAAILLVVGYRLIDWRQLVQLRKKAPFEAAVFLTTAAGILATDFVSGVAIGVVAALAHFAYQQRAALRNVVVTPEGAAGGEAWLARSGSGGAGERTRVVRLEGPLFFGSQDRIETLFSQADATDLILDVGAVSTSDTSGAMALSKALGKLAARGVRVRVSGVGPTTDATLEAALGSFAKAALPEPRAAFRSVEEPRRRGGVELDAASLANSVVAQGDGHLEHAHEQQGWGYAPR